MDSSALGTRRSALGAAGSALDAEMSSAERRVPSAEHLVIQTSFLGDTVLTTPLIAELARRGPVDVVVTPASAALLANNPDIRQLVTYDKRGRESGIGGLRRLGKRLRSGADDLRGNGRSLERRAYLAQGSLRSAALAMLAGCSRRVGFLNAPGSVLYTDRLLRRDDLHHAERLLRLAFPEGGDSATEPERLRPRLYPGDHERRQVDELLAEAGIHGAFVALAPGSVWGTKRWPYYPHLARALRERASIVVIGGSDDADAARAIGAEAAGASVLDATGRLSLLGSAELIGRARVLVTNDSSPLHLASAMGTPTVAMFGPTVPEFGFGPLAPESTAVGLESLPCRPCHHHGPRSCPLGHWRCMRDVGEDRVVPLVTSILDSQ